MPRVFQVGFARAIVEGLFGTSRVTFEQALAESWTPGGEVTRYGRTWRISRPRLSGSYWTGRIGFIREGELTTVGWDPKQEDFRTEEASGGVIVPLTLSAETGVIAFQLRSGVVRPTTFTGALQGLLNQSQTYRWQVQPLVIERPYPEWRQTVVRVSEARFRLLQPNPNWADRKEVEHIVDQLEAQVARLEARAAQGEGLNDASPLFKQALDHTLAHYGRAVVRGVDAQEVESEWDSSGGGTIPVREDVEVETEADEVPQTDLTETLRRREAELRDLRTGQTAEDTEA